MYGVGGVFCYSDDYNFLILYNMKYTLSIILALIVLALIGSGCVALMFLILNFVRQLAL